MVYLPPGLRYLAQVTLSTAPPSILTFLVLSASAKRGASIPFWLVVLSSGLSRPAFLGVHRFWKEIRNYFDSNRHGALIVPRVYDPWPGGLSLIAEVAKNSKTGFPGDIFYKWCQEYGNTYILRLLGEDRLITFEPEHVKAILATQFDSFEKGPVFFAQFTAFLGTGVFNSDGEMWRFHRTITRPFFSKDRISHFEVFDRHAEDALDQAQNRLVAGYPIDFQDLVSRFTLDSATEFLFGNDVRCLSAGLSYPPPSSKYPPAPPPPLHEHPSTTFANAFIQGQILSTRRTPYGPLWALIEFWKDRVRPHRVVVDEFVEPILEEALRNNRERMEKEPGKEGEEINSSTLLDHLVCQTQDRQILKDELINLLVASRDTTASTLTFAMFMLTQHPSIITKLRAEIARKVGTGCPTYEQVKEMKYMRAFINETLRLYPPVPFDSRTSTKPTTLKNQPTPSNPDAKPYYIQAHTKCTYGVFVMHRRTDLWGPDANEFDPDRFLDERLHKYFTPNPYIFLPFNAGPRICLGQQFAYHEVSFFLTRLLQRFGRFKLVTPSQPDSVRLGVHLTMYVKDGLWIHMDPAPLDTESEFAKPPVE